MPIDNEVKKIVEGLRKQYTDADLEEIIRELEEDDEEETSIDNYERTARKR